MSISASRRLRALFGVFWLGSILVAGGAAAAPASPQAAIEQEVLDELAAADRATFWVVLREQADLSRAPSIESWNARGQYVYDQLTDTAERTQGALRSELQRRGVDYRPFWIVNAVRVTADRAAAH